MVFVQRGIQASILEPLPILSSFVIYQTYAETLYHNSLLMAILARAWEKWEKDKKFSSEEEIDHVPSWMATNDLSLNVGTTEYPELLCWKSSGEKPQKNFQWNC